jgi:hypothetical protein
MYRLMFLLCLLMAGAQQASAAECGSTANRSGCEGANGAVGNGPNGAGGYNKNTGQAGGYNKNTAPRCLVWVAEFGLASHERDDRLLVVDAAPVDLWATRLRCPQIHRRDLASAFRQPEWSHWSAPLPDRSESDGGRSPQP